AQEVVGFTLIDASTDQEIRPLRDGDTINFKTEGAELNIRADVRGNVGRVRFELNSGQGTETESETAPPYSIGGDRRGDYDAWTPSPGEYRLTVIPFADGSGAQGKAKTIAFTVVGTPKRAPLRTGAEPAEGFGVNKGGLGGEEVVVTTFAELAKAIKRSNVYIKVKGDLIATGKATIGSGSNLTIDGGGAATLWGNRNPAQRMLELTGKNVVIKDIRLRNSGDNLSFKAPAEYVLVSHVTTSGAMDDGMSISYGTKNVTVQYCFFVGNTRSCFIKYEGAGNISMHHNWFKAQYMRGPLVSSAQFVDIRNQIGEDWATWGGPRFERGATGNCINSVFVMTGAAPGKKDAADSTYQDGGPAYFHGSIYRGCSGRPGNSETEIPCVQVTTHTAEEAEKIVRVGAGCLPRDAIDKAYAEGTKWPRMGERRPWLINVGPGQPFVPTESVKKTDEKKVTKKEGTRQSSPLTLHVALWQGSAMPRALRIEFEGAIMNEFESISHDSSTCQIHGRAQSAQQERVLAIPQ
ncbi:MAG: hypothetical protein KAI41_07030, partial [Hyphomicrobiaceae bacterium]|nr:hypothetical protein [Hyphomicrobiaceae bacterium]